MLTLGQAAKIAGVGKTTLTRAIQAGKLSATPHDDGGIRVCRRMSCPSQSETPPSTSSTTKSGQ
jgi:hypothetical protein